MKKKILLTYFMQLRKKSHTSINPKDLESCFFVYAKKNNERIKAQNGLFIIYGIDSKIQKEICQRLVIDKDSKKNILKQLENINITNQTLFPELESTAKFLKKRYGGTCNDYMMFY